MLEGGGRVRFWSVVFEEDMNRRNGGRTGGKWQEQKEQDDGRRLNYARRIELCQRKVSLSFYGLVKSGMIQRRSEVNIGARCGECGMR